MHSWLSTNTCVHAAPAIALFLPSFTLTGLQPLGHAQPPERRQSACQHPLTSLIPCCSIQDLATNREQARLYPLESFCCCLNSGAQADLEGVGLCSVS